VLVDQSTLDDAGVFAWGRGEALVQTVDFFPPIVDDPYDFGQIAAANALSDVYAMGGRPLTALALLCAPQDTLPAGTLREMVRGGRDKMREGGASVVGGHSVRDPELKFGYAVTGVVRRRHMLTNAGARPGDALVLTKPLGTGVLATVLKAGRLEPTLCRRMTRVMATLNRAAAETAIAFGARAATDVTGYGLLGHAHQMAEASGVTLRLAPARDWFMPRVLELAGEGVLPGGQRRNRAFFSERTSAEGIEAPVLDALCDPQTSGGLLVAVPGRRLQAFRAALRRRRAWHVVAGEVRPRGGALIELLRP